METTGMIVNAVESGWEIIYHRAHALLAAQTRPERWVEILATISDHDDLAREWEGGQLNEAGAPMDFRQSKATTFEPFYKLLESSLYRGRWVALLTSMHLCFLATPERETSADAARFLDEQKKQQAAWRRALKVGVKEANNAYAFMQWCDRLSLILAMRQIPMRERALEISRDGDGKRYDLTQAQDGTLHVSPWPFVTDRFVVRCEATYIKQLKFKNDAELVKALKAGNIRELCWTFGKQRQNDGEKVTGESYEPDKT
jgi:hypothetical protein